MDADYVKKELDDYKLEMATKIGHISGTMDNYQKQTREELDRIERKLTSSIKKVQDSVERYGAESSEGITRLYSAFGFDEDPNAGYNMRQMFKHYQDARKERLADWQVFKRAVIVAMVGGLLTWVGLMYNAYNNNKTAEIVREMAK